VLDSDEMIAMPRVPRSLTVIGAGVIGIEYATIFSALDVNGDADRATTTFLDFVDRELIEDFTHQLRDRGMTIRLGSKVDGVEPDEQGWPVTDAGGRPPHPVGDAALYRRPGGRDRTLGLENCGLTATPRPAEGRSRTFQTEAPHIYAAGDVIGFPSLASTSMEQGRIAACHAFGLPDAAGAGVLPLRHLRRARDLHRRA
jgi:NAD(P) transhydrogenase